MSVFTYDSLRQLVHSFSDKGFLEKWILENNVNARIYVDGLYSPSMYILPGVLRIHPSNICAIISRLLDAGVDPNLGEIIDIFSMPYTTGNSTIRLLAMVRIAKIIEILVDHGLKSHKIQILPVINNIRNGMCSLQTLNILLHAGFNTDFPMRRWYTEFFSYRYEFRKALRYYDRVKNVCLRMLLDGELGVDYGCLLVFGNNCFRVENTFMIDALVNTF